MNNMKKLITMSILVIGLSSCTKDEVCFKSSRIFVDNNEIIQEFEDGTQVKLGNQGELYTPFNNTCEL